MRHPAVIVLALITLRCICASVPSATFGSGYIHYIDDESDRRNFGLGWRDSYQTPQPLPQRSYIIYDGDVQSQPGARDRPRESSTRPWHLEFNSRRRQAEASQPVPSLAYQSIYSNLIQVYDEPQQRKYYGPFDGKTYLEPERGYHSYPRPRPLEVPKYDVVYPNERDRNKHFFNDQLPEKFPTPFSPNKNFEIKDPPPITGPRIDFGLFRTQTINYPGHDTPELENRGNRIDRCNYIRLNEKGFPSENELCGRSISDIILAPDYPNTGELFMEHRKRYRGYNQERIEEKNEIKQSSPLKRQKRSADSSSQFHDGFNSYPYSSGFRSIKEIILAPHYPNTGELVLEGRKRYRGSNQERLAGEKNEMSPSLNRQKRSAGSSYRFDDKLFNPYSHSSGCCGYGYRPYYKYSNGPEYRYDIVSRPYDYERGSDSGYGYHDEGQYFGNNGDEVVEETSNNRGLSSYVNKRGRGDSNGSYESNEDSERRDEKNGSNNGRSEMNGGRGNQKGKSNRGSGSRNSSSNRNSSDRSRNQSGYNSRRNLERDSDSEDNYYNNGSSNNDYYNRNGGGNYNYMRTYDGSNGRGYGSSGYYGGMGGFGSSYGGNVGGGTYGSNYGSYGMGDSGSYGRGSSGFGYGR